MSPPVGDVPAQSRQVEPYPVTKHHSVCKAIGGDGPRPGRFARQVNSHQKIDLYQSKNSTSPRIVSLFRWCRQCRPLSGGCSRHERARPGASWRPAGCPHGDQPAVIGSSQHRRRCPVGSSHQPRSSSMCSPCRGTHHSRSNRSRHTHRSRHRRRSQQGQGPVRPRGSKQSWKSSLERGHGRKPMPPQRVAACRAASTTGSIQPHPIEHPHRPGWKTVRSPLGRPSAR